ncbi:CubicO group peptidase (beta-lactamase class C family) [Mobilisporobacter senegalensis]|uniref:CubicO group peptidase (Beta-lactamase class C family) n=1 Tax=Mobilisporobacter senegalensis TaxID=1329262 RepID=A0A3N1XRU1_9FIRM|nr:serine hydrolase [Mobilisporobacter senegalensis]ROR29383.1 CubicO group peptidase (beta-lactamase class C family) [Mobilisporobacter senegalensis]
MKLDEKDLSLSEFNGCIRIIKKKEIIFEKSYGYADLPNQIPNKIDTKFATASAGKIFVAVAILQLIEKGVLNFDTTIGSILDFNLKAIDPKITIKQLLNHTSGIPDYFDESLLNDYEELWKDYPNYKIRASSDIIPLFIDKPMMYQAGERFQYNNTGYVVLGLVIEKVTGFPFDNYLNEHIFRPCKMQDTGYYELDRLPANCANSYIYDDKLKEFYINIYSVDAKGTGAGGAFTTVIDVGKFWSKLLACDLISKDMLNQMLRVQSHDDRHYYGLGVWLDPADSHIFTPHIEGCDPGVSFISAYNTINDLSITIVSNIGCNVWRLKRDIINTLEKNECFN